MVAMYFYLECNISSNYDMKNRYNIPFKKTKLTFKSLK